MAEVTGITGNGRVYKRFNVDNDIIEDQSFVETKGLWSGNVGDLYNFYTGSNLTAAQKEHYYSVYQSQSSACDAAPQFYVSWGHRLGSGSVGDGGTANDTPSRAIYSQHRLLCLDPDDEVFTFKSASSTVDSDNIYIVSFARDRMQDKVDPGNWELSLAFLNGSDTPVVGNNTVVTLIDDSYDSDERFGWLGLSSPVYNVVSGTISDGVYAGTDEAYGLFYPDLGLIILNGDRLDPGSGGGLFFQTNQTSGVNGNNAFKLYKSISGSGSPVTAGRSTTFPFTARSVEKVTTAHYFVRVTNRDFNFSNNPTYVTGSEGQLKHQSFEKDPKTYITTVGLYNDRYELLAVAKLSQPIQKSFTDESLFIVKLEY